MDTRLPTFEYFRTKGHPERQRSFIITEGKEKYEKQRVLGKGRFGQVSLFQRVDEDPQKLKIDNTPKELAVKEELPINGRYRQAASMQNEGVIWKLKHGVAAIAGDCHSKNEPHYLLMPYIKGTLLERYVFLNRLELLSALVSILKEVEALHRLGYIHLDLHLSNIILRSAQFDEKAGTVNPNLIDFGYSKKTGELGGKFDPKEHIPPELSLHQKIPVGPEQDIFRLGFAFYALIKNSNHFTGSIGILLKSICKLMMSPDAQQRISIPKAIACFQFFIDNIDKLAMVDMYEYNFKLNELIDNPWLALIVLMSLAPDQHFIRSWQTNNFYIGNELLSYINYDSACDILMKSGRKEEKVVSKPISPLSCLVKYFSPDFFERLIKKYSDQLQTAEDLAGSLEGISPESQLIFLRAFVKIKKHETTTFKQMLDFMDRFNDPKHAETFRSLLDVVSESYEVQLQAKLEKDCFPGVKNKKRVALQQLPRGRFFQPEELKKYQATHKRALRSGDFQALSQRYMALVSHR